MFRRMQPSLTPQTHKMTLFADYFQVHISDDGSGGDLSDAWTDEASSRGLAAADGIIGISTARNVDLPVTVSISADAPDVLPETDSIVEADLECTSGRLVVMGCTDYYPDARRLEVPPGWYRVRATAHGLGTVREQWLNAADEYRIDLWPTAPTGLKVVQPHTWS